MNHIQRLTIIRRCLAQAALSCLLLSMAAFQPVWAQDTKPDPVAKVQLSAGQLKSVEGYYQSQANKELVVQFTASENGINAKLLWNGGQLRLLPSSDSSFVNTQEGEEGRPLTVVFRKGADGSVVQASVGGNGLWDKVKDYKPVVKTEMPHTAEQLKPFEGVYQNQHNNNQFIQFTEKDNKLVLRQHWDGTEIKFVPQSELVFFSREAPPFSLRFIKGPDSSIAQALAFGRDEWDKVKPVHPTPADLKIYEGKYRFKDDPDDLIQVTVKGANLAVKQLWDGKETIVVPMADLYFYNNEQSYPIKFKKDNNGIITQVLVLDGDVFEKIGK